MLLPPLWHLVAQCCPGPCCEKQRDCLFGIFPSRFGDESHGEWRHCHKSTIWLSSSVNRAHIRCVRVPAFESLTGHLLVHPLLYMFYNEMGYICSRLEMGTDN